MGIINKKSLRERLNSKDLRIGAEEMESFCKLLGEEIGLKIEFLKREMLLCGRKNVGKEDLNSVFAKD